MKLLKYWYYGTMFLIFNTLFRISLDWASDYGQILALADKSTYYWEKWLDNGGE